MIQEYLHLVLVKRRFPGDLRNFFAIMYNLSAAVESAGEDELYVLFWYLCGVLQGCAAT